MAELVGRDLGAQLVAYAYAFSSCALASPGKPHTALGQANAEGGDHTRPQFVEGLGDRRPDVDHAHGNGRTSAFRLPTFDPSAATLSVTSRSGPR